MTIADNVVLNVTRTPLQSLTEKNLFTHTKKRRRSIEVTLAFFIFSSTNYNVAKKNEYNISMASIYPQEMWTTSMLKILT